MMSTRIARVATLRNAIIPTRRLPIIQRRTFIPNDHANPRILEEKYPTDPTMTEAEDPGQNGGYINPPFIKRQHRDPYGDWWDKQERRNFGEPVHEDNDLLAMLSPYDYTWTTTGPALIMLASFTAVFLSVVGVVYLNYPDKPSFPREFEGGLSRELGGAGAVRARMAGDADPKRA